jgi:hypothetical protein
MISEAFVKVYIVAVHLTQLCLVYNRVNTVGWLCWMEI